VTDRQHASPPDPPPGPVAAAGHGPREAVRLAVVVGALGVVFGDIGTSPIYTLQSTTTYGTNAS
jgi:KUP system potassium uptake protein